MLAAATAGCSENPPTSDGPINVVATISIAGDIARNVVGSHGSVTVLLPIGADPHDYYLSARQVQQLFEADLVVAIGLGLEEGMSDVLLAVAADGVPVLELALEVAVLLPGPGGPALDPHFWLDPIRAGESAMAVAAALSEVRSDVSWSQMAEVYVHLLEETDREMFDLLARIRPADRLLATNHDSLRYFADRYDFEIVGSVFPTGSGFGDPSSENLTQLVAAINRNRIPAVFTDVWDSSGLAETIANEADHQVFVVPLFTGSLGGAGSEAETLIEMLRTNAGRIADAVG
jgi:zinc/manganese transport system substrate-binding protein